MINLYQIRKRITKSVTKSVKYLFTAWYGRFILGAILTIVGGVLSPYGTIDFLSTDYEFFTYVATLGMLVIAVQILIMIAAAIYMAIIKDK
jgi:hypothetical protein